MVALQCEPFNGVSDYVNTNTYASTNDQWATMGSHTNINSAFYPLAVDKSITSLAGWLTGVKGSVCLPAVSGGR